jgi:PAS domain-containing protein
VRGLGLSIVGTLAQQAADSGHLPQPGRLRYHDCATLADPDGSQSRARNTPHEENDLIAGHRSGVTMQAIPNVDFSPQNPEPTTSGSTLLIVDDEERIRTAYRQLLAAEGRKIEDCGSGSEALRRLERRDVDLLILDLNLPDINGLEIMEWMVTKHIADGGCRLQWRRIHRLGDPRPAPRCLEFIRKHGDPQELIDTVDRVLHRRRIEREHALMTVRLEHSERLHRFLVEQSPDIIYTLDKNGHFIFVNGRVHGLLGYTREELLGKHYSTDRASG